ncbi:hypothetical protein HMPREF1582_00693 [Gardnerella vaginalis JCP8151A]|nr:hypothetical protein HMPREF1582_00693 [Gardnerella vaginalis JCP8151A]
MFNPDCRSRTSRDSDKSAAHTAIGIKDFADVTWASSLMREETFWLINTSFK